MEQMSRWTALPNAKLYMGILSKRWLHKSLISFVNYYKTLTGSDGHE